MTYMFNNNRLAKVVLFSHQSEAEPKAHTPRKEWKQVTGQDLRRTGTPWEGVKREALKRLELSKTIE